MTPAEVAREIVIFEHLSNNHLSTVCWYCRKKWTVVKNSKLEIKYANILKYREHWKLTVFTISPYECRYCRSRIVWHGSLDEYERTGEMYFSDIDLDLYVPVWICLSDEYEMKLFSSCTETSRQLM